MTVIKNNRVNYRSNKRNNIDDDILVSSFKKLKVSCNSMTASSSFRKQQYNKNIFDYLTDDIVEYIALYNINILFLVKNPSSKIQNIINEYVRIQKYNYDINNLHPINQLSLVIKNPDDIKLIKEPVDQLKILSIRYNILKPFKNHLNFEYFRDIIMNKNYIQKLDIKNINDYELSNITNKLQYLDGMSNKDKLYNILKSYSIINELKIINNYNLNDQLSILNINLLYIYLIDKPSDYITKLYSELCIKRYDVAINELNKVKNLHELYKIINENMDIKDLLQYKIDELHIRYINTNGGLSIRYIKNPSQKVCIHAVKRDYRALWYIKNHCNIIKNYINNNNDTIIQSRGNYYLKNVSSYNEIYMNQINNSSDEIKMREINTSDENIFKYLINPSEQVKLYAINIDWKNIMYINNPSIEIQRIIVRTHGYLIMYIDNPSEEIQLLAIQKSLDAFVHIKNPCQKVIDAYNDYIKTNPRHLDI